MNLSAFDSTILILPVVNIARNSMDSATKTAVRSDRVFSLEIECVEDGNSSVDAEAYQVFLGHSQLSVAEKVIVFDCVNHFQMSVFVLKNVERLGECFYADQTFWRVKELHR